MIKINYKVKKLLYDVIFYFLIINLVAVCLFVPFVSLITSFQNDTEVLSIPAKFIPRPPRFINYINLWKETSLLINIKNGLIVTLSSIGLVLLISMLAAFALSSLYIPGKEFFMLLLLFTQMFSPVVILLPLFKLFKILNLLDSLLGLILVNSTFCLAFSTLLFKAFFDTIPNDIIEASLIDGCNKFQSIIKIILPISAPGIFVVTVYIFTQVWNEFLFAFTFIFSTEKYTPIVGLFSLIQTPFIKLPPWNLAMAFSIVISIPVIILFYLRKSDMVEGLAAGAIK